MIVNVGVTGRDFNGVLMYMGLPLANDQEDREVLQQHATKIDALPTRMQIRFGILCRTDGYLPELEWTKEYGFYDVIVEEISISESTEPFILEKAMSDADYVPEFRLKCRFARDDDGRIAARIPSAITIGFANFLSTLGLIVESCEAEDEDGFRKGKLVQKRDETFDVFLNGESIGSVEVY